MHLRHIFLNSTCIIFSICIIRASSWGWQAFQNEGIEAFEDFFHLYIVRTRQLLPKHDLFVAPVLWTGVCVGLTFTVIFSFQIYTTFWEKKKKPFLKFIQLFSHVQLFVTPWTAACQASLSITNSQSPPKPMSIESVIPSNHLILCHTLLLPSIFPSIRVFSNESAVCIRWPKYWSFSFSISPSNEYSGLISFRIDGWISLQSKGLFNTTVQKHQFFGAQLSLKSNSPSHTWLPEKPYLWLYGLL